MSDLLQEMLSERPWLLADGAIGTNFFATGLKPGGAPELWNVDEPDKVLAQYRSFVEAGSDIILTNTFGGTRNRMKFHKATERVTELNAAAARLARQVAEEAGREVVVAGSMGPTGDMFMPLGELSMVEGTAAFAEQANALAEGGVDVLWIETVFAFEELTAAVTGARGTGLPVVCTMSFDSAGRTMMGITPAQLVQELNELSPRPIAYGGNCGIGPSELLAVLVKMREAAVPDDVLVVKSNCGIPRIRQRRDHVPGHARADGRLRTHVRGCGRADHRRLLRHDAGAHPGHARSARGAHAGPTAGHGRDRRPSRANLQGCRETAPRGAERAPARPVILGPRSAYSLFSGMRAPRLSRNRLYSQAIRTPATKPSTKPHTVPVIVPTKVGE